MYLNKDDILNFNVDEIEIYGTFSNYEKLLKGINDSNSDYITFLDFTLKKSNKLRDYVFKVDFWKNNLPCFAFYIGKQISSKIITRDYFKVYGSAFQMLELNEIIDFIDIYIELDLIDKLKKHKTNTLKRFDLALDLKKDINLITKNFKDLNQKGTKYFGNKGELETYYIGEYKKRLNKGVLIRIYDKIKDIKYKGKQVLYPNYLLEENVTRIEIEFRSEVIKFFNLNQLLDKNYIFNLFIIYIEKHTKILDKVKTYDVKKLKRLNKKINLNDLKYNSILRDRYISVFLGYSKNILKIGACPIDILFKNLVISELTEINIILGIEENKFNPIKYTNLVNAKRLKNMQEKIKYDDGGD